MGALESVAKLFLLLLGFFFFYVLFILFILKEDGFTEITDWPWKKVIFIPLTGILLFLFCYVCCNVFSYESPDLQPLDMLVENDDGVSSDKKKRKTRGEILQHNKAYLDNVSKFLHSLRIDRLEHYHETSTFRSLLLLFCYSCFLVFDSFAIIIPCHHCSTPYHIVAIVLCVTFGVRWLTQFVALFSNYRYHSLMTKELQQLQYSYSQKDYRFFRKVLPDLNRGRTLWFLNSVDRLMWILTFSFALFSSIWVLEGNCQSSCPRLFQGFKNLMIALWVLEVFYVASVLFMQSLKQSMGVEGIEKIVAALQPLKPNDPVKAPILTTNTTSDDWTQPDEDDDDWGA